MDNSDGKPDVLDFLAGLVSEVKSAKSAHGNIFGHIGATPHLEGLELPDEVVSEEELDSILAKIEEAKHHDEVMAAIVKSLPTVLGALKMALLIV